VTAPKKTSKAKAPKTPKPPKPDTKARSLWAAKLTPQHMEALQDAYNRARDDWDNYQDDPHAPEDLGGVEEWEAYRAKVDASMTKARAALEILKRAMRVG